MAKVAPKKVAKEPRKSAPKKAAGSPVDRIESTCEQALEKLRELEIHQPLQNDIEWCLGSYRSDRNPVGLYAMAERALVVFQEERARKTKGVTAKLITDLEKVLEERS